MRFIRDNKGIESTEVALIIAVVVLVSVSLSPGLVPLGQSSVRAEQFAKSVSKAAVVG